MKHMPFLIFTFLKINQVSLCSSGVIDVCEPTDPKFTTEQISERM